MKVDHLVKLIGADFYTGIPDSQLKALCNYLMGKYGLDPRHHIIAANEGNCTALAAGYHLVTGRVPVVYMQNSGEGNIINPVASLLHEKVYAIPMIFIIGWRGEPGIQDEPQHVFQGEITLKLLEDLGIAYYVINKKTSDEELATELSRFDELLKRGKQIALVVSKDALTDAPQLKYQNNYTITREETIKHIVMFSGEDPIISTTGKASRELYEIRNINTQDHKYDFLTVGSMGHMSSIALGMALNKPSARFWCIDGDGAILMHLGAFAVIGAYNPKNLVHIVINNAAHESVGGMPTVANTIDIVAIARACGYPNAVTVDNLSALDKELYAAKQRAELSLIEIKCSLGSRENLGRPNTTPLENKQCFMENIDSIKPWEDMQII